jgi:hypothetical protein
VEHVTQKNGARDSKKINSEARQSKKLNGDAGCVAGHQWVLSLVTTTGCVADHSFLSFGVLSPVILSHTEDIRS